MSRMRSFPDDMIQGLTRPYSRPLVRHLFPFSLVRQIALLHFDECMATFLEFTTAIRALPTPVHIFSREFLVKTSNQVTSNQHRGITDTAPPKSHAGERSRGSLWRSVTEPLPAPLGQAPGNVGRK